MEEKFLTFDMASFVNTKKIIDGKYNELLSMVNHYKNIIEDTKKVFDTECATLYRKVAIGYIEVVQRYLDNEFKPYVDRLDEIKVIYSDEYNAIEKSVNGENR